jgi:hypothetical protein
MLAHSIRSLPAALALAATLLTIAGCSRSSAPAALALDQVPARLDVAFGQAQGESRSLSAAAAAAVRHQSASQALVPLHALSAEPALTAEQRAVVARSLVAVHSKLRQQAAEGDADAQSLLQAYRASK